MGWAILLPKDHTEKSEFKILLNAEELVPKFPVNENWGRRFFWDAFTRTWVEAKFLSAEIMSGRFDNKLEGIPAGTDSGSSGSSE